MPMKMRLKMKNKSQRYDINRPKSKHGCKYTKYEMYLVIIMVICIKQHIVLFEAQFMEKLSDTEAEVKKALLIKKRTLR